MRNAIGLAAALLGLCCGFAQPAVACQAVSVVTVDIGKGHPLYKEDLVINVDQDEDTVVVTESGVRNKYEEENSVAMSRLHSDILTEESPAVWWSRNREKILTKLQEPDTSSHERLSITTREIGALMSDEPDFELSTRGELAEFMENFQNLCLNANTQNGLTEAEVALMKEAALDSARWLRSVRDNKKSTVPELLEDLSAYLRKRTAPRLRERFAELINDTSYTAWLMIAREREAMSRLYVEIPERVIVDAILNVIYNNKKTFAALPQFNRKYFYESWNGEHEQAVRESLDILREIGPGALPFLERAVTELEGYVYVPASERKGAKRERIEDQRLNGKLPNPYRRYNDVQKQDVNTTAGATSTTESMKSVQVAVDLDTSGPVWKRTIYMQMAKVITKHTGIQKTVTNYTERSHYIDTTVDIPVNCQLLPLAMDFQWVFDARYNTRFYRNDDALAQLKQLHREISRSRTGGIEEILR